MEGTFAKFSVVTLLLAMACNPAGRVLEQARSSGVAGDVDAALESYRVLLDKYPESDEAKGAKGAAADLLLRAATSIFQKNPLKAVGLIVQAHSKWGDPATPSLDDDVAAMITQAIESQMTNQDFLGAAALLKAVGDTDLPQVYDEARSTLIRTHSNDRGLSCAIRWLGSDGSSVEARGKLALALVAEDSAFQKEIQGWLDQNLIQATKTDCYEPLQELDKITSVSALDAVNTSCRSILKIAPNARRAEEIRKALDEQVARRRKAIKSSPSYKMESAFDTCRKYVAFVRRSRSRMRSLARQQRTGELYKYQAKAQRDLNRWEPKLMRALNYLRSRVESEGDLGTKASLVRRIERECQP